MSRPYSCGIGDWAAPTEPDRMERWIGFLDRLVEAHAGRDVAAVDWDAYYPSLAEHYRDEFS